jgi:hypothetical protein
VSDLLKSFEDEIISILEFQCRNRNARDGLPLKLHTENTYSKLINLSNECTSTTGCEINMKWNSPDDGSTR